MASLLTKLFSTKQERDVKRLKPFVAKINAHEDACSKLSDTQMLERIAALKDSVQQSKNPSAMLRTHLPETFAIVREAAKRSLKMRHFDVQLMGGIVLFEGGIAEMKTGEGKTLVAPLTAVLRSLTGNGVHIVTVNDHLAKRDAEWMRPLYESLGLSVGSIVHGMNYDQKHIAYQADITYATNNELGFDYLRDNMVLDKAQRVQRGHHFCIIDEVDSILIDEARTPLIISGPSESNTEQYYTINRIIPRLSEAKRDEKKAEIRGTGDYVMDAKDRTVLITEDGVHKIEDLLGIENLYNAENTSILHHVTQALRAHKLFTPNIDYIVEDGQIKIIDEFTGRKMDGRRFSDGLHQAIEAKENVNILSENQTIATITLQNYFRMYDTIAGMTGTADTEAEEFAKIYNLQVSVIPTHEDVARLDQADKIYRTEKEKFHAIVEKVKAEHTRGRPILIGTASVEKSELLSRMLKSKGLPHELLNAKHHEREAHIIEQAGMPGAITIATNMAGRGTDIKLHAHMTDLGGLLVVGSERHDARRIDNQLRGRSGRQGDPGESIFYLSLDDSLMRRFHSERVSQIMVKLGMREGDEIQHPLITKQIENAQKKVEARNFEIRKHLLEYDDVMNTQRSFIYKERNTLLQHDDLQEEINLYISQLISQHLSSLAAGSKGVTEALYEALHPWVNAFFKTPFPWEKAACTALTYDELEDQLTAYIQKQYAAKRDTYDPAMRERLERLILLRILDHKWKEHLLVMDHLRDGISLRAYGERRPLIEFKREGLRLFKEMVTNMRMEIVETLFKVQVRDSATPTTQSSPTHPQYTLSHQRSIFKEPAPESTPPLAQGTNLTSNGTIMGRGAAGLRASDSSRRSPIRAQHKIGRNDPCHCGSGKKYKHCHMRQEAPTTH